MIEVDTREGKVVAAALRLAAEEDWSKVTLRDIARAAGLDLAEMREHFASKTDILKAFGKMIDAEVLAKAPKPEPDETARDQLFEVIMARFDAMQPHKEAIRSIVESRDVDPSFMTTLMKSQAWMLEAAGISSDGMRGNMRIAGLASIYTSLVRTWLDDDDPGMAKTMAVLDRRLRRGERTMRNAESVFSACERLGSLFRSGAGAVRERAQKAREAAAAATGNQQSDESGQTGMGGGLGTGDNPGAANPA